MSDLKSNSWPALDASMAEGGMHQHFAKLVGKWKGEAKTWFEPNKLADTSPIEGEFEMVLQGHYLKHRYLGALSGHEMIGEETIACNVDLGRLELAWINTCHTRAQIMHFSGEIPEARNPFSVKGEYQHSPDHPAWGWRIEYDLAGGGDSTTDTSEEPSTQTLTIRHYNITPEREESLAVEIVYQRG